MRGLEETAAAIGEEIKEYSEDLYMYTYRSVLLEKDRGLHQWFLRPDAFGHEERERQGDRWKETWKEMEKQTEEEDGEMKYYIFFLINLFLGVWLRQRKGLVVEKMRRFCFN